MHSSRSTLLSRVVLPTHLLLTIRPLQGEIVPFCVTAFASVLVPLILCFKMILKRGLSSLTLLTEAITSIVVLPFVAP